jgi:phage-related protein
MRPLAFYADSLEAIKRLRGPARRKVGHQLELVQWGVEPDDWKPMPMVGAGVREIRIRDEHGIDREMYVTKFRNKVYVLHCFQKKTQKTRKSDLDLAIRRYKELRKEVWNEEAIR